MWCIGNYQVEENIAVNITVLANIVNIVIFYD